MAHRGRIRVLSRALLRKKGNIIGRIKVRMQMKTARRCVHRLQSILPTLAAILEPRHKKIPGNLYLSIVNVVTVP